MRWSFRIFQVGETRVLIHFTFVLLVAWYAWSGWKSAGPSGAAEQTAFILLLFLSVLLHEFGHILAARRYGIHTPEILLSPIGGIARLASLPTKPMQELAVALAGPAVTLAIVIVGLLAFWASGDGGLFFLDLSHGALWPTVIATNAALLIFNLLPAFPMDGGRVLRALVATRLGALRATRIAARVGQCLAVVFIFFGLRGNFILLLVGLFVFTAAQAELRMAEHTAIMQG
ncbi:MAG TPA: site-2 protease family protein [Gemmatimonadales bacterium]|jgi:Zn-dependent protease